MGGVVVVNAAVEGRSNPACILPQLRRPSQELNRSKAYQHGRSGVTIKHHLLVLFELFLAFAQSFPRMM